jgi:hypothetical protein
VHVGAACAVSREGFDHFGSYIRIFFLHFYNKMFLGLESMTSWSQGNSFTTVRAPLHLVKSQTLNYKGKIIIENLIVTVTHK